MRDVRINLLVSKEGVVQRPSAKFWTVLLVLVSYLVMLGMGYSAFQAKRQAERENAALLDSLKEKNLSVSASNVMDFEQEVRKRSQQIRALKESRRLVTEIWREVAIIFPPEAGLSEFSVDAKGFWAKGRGRDYGTVARILQGFSRSSLFEEARLVECGETASGEVGFSIRAEWQLRKKGE